MDCPFCAIDKSRVLKEGDYVRVILSNPRLMPGHLLVIPKRHVERISELKSEEQEELFRTVVEFQGKILSKLASGCDISQHYRPFQEDDRLKVAHLHIHLQPRKLFDELYENSQVYEKDLFKEMPSKELKRMLRIFSGE
jgi:histidine triad (HIT) family protein